eukprot:Unigene4964_Nuclearia_a/m.15191 Unigene4964_Nuclearia_a/g.15191  ORF Unigene4964_Nuclearia_a/g.15191 Unigene4964_Nuclearia_a/m.15191 type:complete len:119 (+) Unigene4964_Nuclearia_a:265-621(+)
MSPNEIHQAVTAYPRPNGPTATTKPPASAATATGAPTSRPYAVAAGGSTRPAAPSSVPPTEYDPQPPQLGGVAADAPAGDDAAVKNGAAAVRTSTATVFASPESTLFVTSLPSGLSEE